MQRHASGDASSTSGKPRIVGFQYALQRAADYVSSGLGDVRLVINDTDNAPMAQLKQLITLEIAKRTDGLPPELKGKDIGVIDVTDIVVAEKDLNDIKKIAADLLNAVCRAGVGRDLIADPESYRIVTKESENERGYQMSYTPGSNTISVSHPFSVQIFYDKGVYGNGKEQELQENVRKFATLIVFNAMLHELVHAAQEVSGQLPNSATERLLALIDKPDGLTMSFIKNLSSTLVEGVATFVSTNITDDVASKLKIDGIGVAEGRERISYKATREGLHEFLASDALAGILPTLNWMGRPEALMHFIGQMEVSMGKHTPYMFGTGLCAAVHEVGDGSLPSTFAKLISVKDVNELFAMFVDSANSLLPNVRREGALLRSDVQGAQTPTADVIFDKFMRAVIRGLSENAAVAAQNDGPRAALHLTILDIGEIRKVVEGDERLAKMFDKMISRKFWNITTATTEEIFGKYETVSEEIFSEREST